MSLILKLLPLGLASMLLITRASAADHLVPVRTDWNGQLAVSDLPAIASVVFKDAYQPNVRARVYTFVNLALNPEQMIFLRDGGSRYSIVCEQTRSLLGLYGAPVEIRKTFHLHPADYHDIRPTAYQREISRSLGERIVNLWRRELLRTGFDEKPIIGVDGEYLTFSMEEGRNSRLVMAGTTWSPDESEPRLFALANIVWAMEELCLEKSLSPSNRLEKDVVTLEKLK